MDRDRGRVSEGDSVRNWNGETSICGGVFGIPTARNDGGNFVAHFDVLGLGAGFHHDSCRFKAHHERQLSGSWIPPLCHLNFSKVDTRSFDLEQYLVGSGARLLYLSDSKARNAFKAVQFHCSHMFSFSFSDIRLFGQQSVARKSTLLLDHGQRHINDDVQLPHGSAGFLQNANSVERVHEALGDYCALKTSANLTALLALLDCLAEYLFQTPEQRFYFL